MRQSRVAGAALVIAAVTLLSLANAAAQSPGQGVQPPAPPSAAPEPSPAAKPGEGAPAGAKTEAGDASKPAETAPSSGPASPPTNGESPSATFATLLQEGLEVRTTTFVPADAVSRQSGKVSSDAIIVTLQKDAASAVCFYTLKAYVSKKLGSIPACTVHR